MINYKLFGRGAAIDEGNMTIGKIGLYGGRNKIYEKHAF